MKKVGHNSGSVQKHQNQKNGQEKKLDTIVTPPSIHKNSLIWAKLDTIEYPHTNRHLTLLWKVQSCKTYTQLFEVSCMKYWKPCTICTWTLFFLEKLICYSLSSEIGTFPQPMIIWSSWWKNQNKHLIFKNYS